MIVAAVYAYGKTTNQTFNSASRTVAGGGSGGSVAVAVVVQVRWFVWR